MAERTELVQIVPLEGQEPQPRRGCVVGGVEGTGTVEWRDSGDIVAVEGVIQAEDTKEKQQDK